MQVSVIVGTHNEFEYIPTLLDNLVEMVNAAPFESEIIVVDDNSDHPSILKSFEQYRNQIQVFSHAVNGNFGAHKTYMSSLASAPWILNLDADEAISLDLFCYFKELIDANPDYDAYAIPRVNLIDDLPLWYVKEWGCSITSFPEISSVHQKPVAPDQLALWHAYGLIQTETDTEMVIRDPVVAWPDHQVRLYKADLAIVWTKVVHEQLTGYKNLGVLPSQLEYALWHQKTFARQHAQNTSYSAMR
jgi:glycosyltransferase involved in cell wall biosynthesis